jgi:hypothetical protein
MQQFAYKNKQLRMPKISNLVSSGKTTTVIHLLGCNR